MRANSMTRKWGRGVGLVLVLLGFIGHLDAVVDPAEVEALLEIKSQWSVNATWNTGLDTCNWTGIKCDPLGNHVVYFNWNPSYPGNFSGWNRITGDLAPFASLTTLKSFNISWNSGLQAGVGIPEAVFKLTNLTELRIDNCYVTGTLSPRIANLRKLQIFYAGNNTMSGGLIRELAALTDLRELTLWLTSWKSEIPPEFGNLVNLEYLNLCKSQLWGGLPSGMGTLTRMKNLYLCNNQLTGGIPDTWKNMKQLISLSLSSNFLSGNVPSWIWTPNSISSLHLQDNRFTGPYGQNLSTSFITLEVQCNFLTGPTVPVIPDGYTKKLWDVDDNCFTEKLRRVENKCKTNTPCDVYLNSIVNECPPCLVNQTSYVASMCICKPLEISGDITGYPNNPKDRSSKKGPNNLDILE